MKEFVQAGEASLMCFGKSYILNDIYIHPMINNDLVKIGLIIVAAVLLLHGGCTTARYRLVMLPL